VTRPMFWVLIAACLVLGWLLSERGVI
jgi:hypothetical protein